MQSRNFTAMHVASERCRGLDTEVGEPQVDISWGLHGPFSLASHPLLPGLSHVRPAKQALIMHLPYAREQRAEQVIKRSGDFQPFLPHGTQKLTKFCSIHKIYSVPTDQNLGITLIHSHRRAIAGLAVVIFLSKKEEVNAPD